MRTLRSTGLVAGLACAVLAAPAAAGTPANVSVRVEGTSDTLVPRARVATTAQPVNKTGRAGEECSGTSAAGALELATGGDWSGTWSEDFQGYTVERIRTESHPFGGSTYWAFWVNDRPSSAGICSVELQEGDEVLFYPDCFGETCTSPKVLDVSVPPAVRRGVPFSVKAVEYEVTYDANYNARVTPVPAQGVSLSGVGATVVTGPDGTASVTADRFGTFALRATKPERVRTSADVCVSEGDDGTCGTRDRRAPQARITGIAEQQRFARGGAPRALTGAVEADASGLHAVKLRLTRRHRGRCWYFSGRLERFRRTRCGRAFRFGIGDRSEFSYLLPGAPAPGRYVLDVIAVDRAFNRDVLARGRNRVVFHVG